MCHFHDSLSMYLLTTELCRTPETQCMSRAGIGKNSRLLSITFDVDSSRIEFRMTDFHIIWDVSLHWEPRERDSNESTGWRLHAENEVYIAIFSNNYSKQQLILAGPISTTRNTHYCFLLRAGIKAPAGGSFFFLNSSHICSIVTHSTPSCLLMYSMILHSVSQQMISWCFSQCFSRQGPSRLSLSVSPFMHKEHMRSPRNIRVNRHRKDKLIILAIKIVKVILFPSNQPTRKYKKCVAETRLQSGLSRRDTMATPT